MLSKSELEFWAVLMELIGRNLGLMQHLQFFFIPTKSAQANISVWIFERDWVLGRYNIEIEPWDGPLFSEQGLKWAQYSRVSREQIIWQSVTREDIFWLVFSTKLVHRNKLEPLGPQVEPWLALSLLQFVCLFVWEVAIHSQQCSFL